MTAGSTPDNALGQLEQSLASGKLPRDARQKGIHLLERLKSPVRIVILGLPKSGKSQLLNMLAGQVVVPEGATLPSLEVVWGEATQTTLMFEDGSTDVREGLIFDAVSGTDPIFIKVETDIPILKKVSLLEVVADETEEDLTAAIDWASRRADIAIWCSQEFSSYESRLWAPVPDALKDHSFFVLTKADLMSAGGALSEKLPKLQDLVEDEFHSLFPVATLQAISASGASANKNDAVFISSGGRALFAAILKEVESGRRADLDSVLLFLRRYGSIALPDNAGAVSARSEQSSNHEPDQEQKTISGTDGALKFGDDVCSRAFGYLQSQAAQLSKSMENFGSETSSEILNQCVTTADGLTDLFAEADVAEDGLEEIHEDVMETAEVLLLMQVEGGDAPAADAVTLLLQLRKGLEAKIAA